MIIDITETNISTHTSFGVSLRSYICYSSYSYSFISLKNSANWEEWWYSWQNLFSFLFIFFGRHISSPKRDTNMARACMLPGATFSRLVKNAAKLLSRQNHFSPVLWLISSVWCLKNQNFFVTLVKTIIVAFTPRPANKPTAAGLSREALFHCFSRIWNVFWWKITKFNNCCT